jgi:hypothetical protein
VVLLLNFAGSRLRLEPGLRRKIRAAMRKIIGMAAVIGLLAVSPSVSPVHAVQPHQAQGDEFEISIDSKLKQVKMGEVMKFNTVIANRGVQTSSPLIVALNVVNLKEMGEVVDLEEWSPQRTQYIDSLAPDETINLNWIVTTGLHGEYIVYIVLIPEPAGAEDTTSPVASSSLYLTVAPTARLNPSGVLPFALGVPAFLLAITFVVYRRRRQQIDMGDPL